MTSLGKKIRGAALGLCATFSAVTGAQATTNDLSTNEKQMINQFLAKENLSVQDLQWDDIRMRDKTGATMCQDRNNDGVADTITDAYGDTYLDQDGQRYTLYYMYGSPDQRDAGEMHKQENVSKNDATYIMQSIESDATGFLVSHAGVPKGELPDLVVIYSVANQDIKAARPLANVKVGDFGTGLKWCNDVQIPAGMPKPPLGRS